MCPLAQATDVIHGYTVGNDVTARDLQRQATSTSPAPRASTRSARSARGSRTTSTPRSSPTASACVRSSTATSKQDGTTADLIFDIPTLVPHVSRIMTLLPGDVILTGTPAGVGPMQAGQEVEVSIDGLGSLANPVVAR